MKIASILMLFLVMGIVSASTIDIVPQVSCNSTTNTLSIVFLNESNLNVGYSSNTNIALHSQTFTDFINCNISTSSFTINTFTIKAPNNNQPTAKFITLVNGEANQLVNNVMIESPPAVSNTVNIAASNILQLVSINPISNVTFNYTIQPAPRLATHKNLACVNGEANQLINNVTIGCPPALNKTIVLQSTNSLVVTSNIFLPNITITTNVLGIEPCTLSANYISNWSSNSIYINRAYPCNLNITILKNTPIKLNGSVQAGNVFTSNIFGNITIFGKYTDYSINQSLPFNSTFRLSTANIIIRSKNFITATMSYNDLNVIGSMLGVTGANSICPIPLTNKSLNFSILANCNRNYTIQLKFANSQNYTQRKFAENQSSQWQSKYQTQYDADHNGVSVAGIIGILGTGIVILVIIGLGIMYYQDHKNKGDIQKYGMDMASKNMRKNNKRNRDENQ